MATFDHSDLVATRSRWRAALWIVFGLIAALLLIVSVAIGPLLFERNDYAGVPSIEGRADYRDPALMKAAWSLPVAASYQRGIFEYQANASFCGPASISNLLRSQGRPMSQGEVIDGTRYDPWFGILIGGLTLDEVAHLLAYRAGVEAIIVRDATLVQFRSLMARSNELNMRMLLNFHRGPMFGRGHGHFSPVLGYLSDRDLVLIGDVNAEYRPYLVPTERLWKATGTIDNATGKERGIVMVRASSSPTPQIRRAARPL